MRHGKGMMMQANGTLLDGQWAYDKMQGQGVFLSKRVESYIGEWKAGRRHGWGAVSWPKGDLFEG